MNNSQDTIRTRSAQAHTQRASILNVLVSARVDWVPLPKITACAAQYNARIYELRRIGFKIVNRTRDVDGVRHSWYRLESNPPDIRPSELSPEPEYPA